MRMLNRSDFMKLPPGTFYLKGEPWAFRQLAIKQETLPPHSPDAIGDWYYIEPSWIDADSSEQAINRLEEMLVKGSSYPLDTSIGRDGYFEERDIFLVFEKPDLLALRAFVDAAIEISS